MAYQNVLAMNKLQQWSVLRPFFKSREEMYPFGAAAGLMERVERSDLRKYQPGRREPSLAGCGAEPCEKHYHGAIAPAEDETNRRQKPNLFHQKT